MTGILIRSAVKAGRWVFGMGLTLTAVAGMSMGSASADQIVGLATDNVILNFDSSTPGTSSGLIQVTGFVDSRDRLVGIDYRPADGLLYGVTVGDAGVGRIYTIDNLSGAASLVSTLDTTLTGLNFGADFNPVPDRLRLISATGDSFRINVETGATIIDGALNPGSPSVTAAAYTNSLMPSPRDPATLGTTLYGIDTDTDSLVLINPPNAGTVNVVGSLGFNVGEFAAFDIFGANNVAYGAWTGLGGGNSSLYTINLSTGAATSLGQVYGGVSLRGIAVKAVPEPASLAMLGLGGASLIGFVRRRKAGQAASSC